VTALEALRAVIVAAATSVGDRVSPDRTYQGDSYPYAIITELSNDPLTALSGWAGIDHCEVEVSVYGQTFDDADSGARACRTALEAAGYVCLRKNGDQSDTQIDPALSRVGFVFDVWQS
jgi:hypothetical protein